MGRQIRRLGVAFLALYGLLFGWLNWIQLVRADEYNDHAGNTRAIVRDYGRPRGQILAADGTVLARSEATDGRFGRRREYPLGDLFAPVTGYFSFTFGSDGVERTYNAHLAGRATPDSVKSLTDLLLDRETTRNVILTLPVAVQQAAKDALGDRTGSVVALDPRDGSILALWSTPSYDPNPISQTDQKAAEAAKALVDLDPRRPLLPRSFRETFFPGSTFKVVTAAAGLRAGVTPQGPVYPNEREYVPPNTTRPIRNFGGATCGGALFDILRVSCNTAFARMGIDSGARVLVEQSEAFGFNDRPPLDLPRPAASSIRDVEFFRQNVPLVAQTAIGQNTVRASPLQMALVAAAVANGGRVMAPHVLREIRDDDEAVVESWEPVVWQQPLDATQASVLRDAMVGVVASGTARALAVPGVTTAGKTGTAQVGNGTSHAWIIGFAPAEAPRVAIAVIVEGQPGASEATGGRVAAPIGRAVLEAALRALPAG